MKKLKTMLFVLLASVATTTSPLLAGSADFAGPYVALSAQALGLELDGKHTDSNSVDTNGKAGFVTPVVGLEAGYNFPVTDVMFLDISARWQDTDGQFVADDVDNVSDVTVRSGDHWTVSISPGFAITDSSSVYAKIGWNMMELTATGDLNDKTQDMEGMTYGIGTIALLPNGMFFKTEVGVNLYDNVSWDGLASDADGGTAKFSGDPTSVYGALSIGVKF